LPHTVPPATQAYPTSYASSHHHRSASAPQHLWHRRSVVVIPFTISSPLFAFMISRHSAVIATYRSEDRPGVYRPSTSCIDHHQHIIFTHNADIYSFHLHRQEPPFTAFTRSCIQYLYPRCHSSIREFDLPLAMHGLCSPLYYITEQ